jgi:1-aminocyclopropane-1-carboxylate deaminase/D-cysteine desulfhydrase-like pyridoxal-dependent ACC family enzyme
MMLSRRQALALLGTASCAALAPRSPTQAPAPRDASPPSVTPPRVSNSSPPAAAERAPGHVFPLFDQFPNLARSIPRAVLGAWPTPVLPLVDLAKEIGVSTLHVKRDDLSAKPYGGGKPRKLELFLGEAVSRQKAGVITFGGVGSHHAVATAIYAKQLGLSCRLKLLPQPPTEEVRRVLVTCQHHGAELELVGSLASAEARAARLADDFLIIPPGGSSPVGNVGFINAALELAAQVERKALPIPDVIFVAVGTMGTAVGLAIGLALAKLPTRIVGVRAASWSAASPRKLRDLHAASVTWLRSLDATFPALKLAPNRFRFENRFLGRGYAQPTPTGDAAAKRASKYGLRLDPTYTAKAFAALLGRASDHADQHVLFWHTNSHWPLTDVGDPRALPKPLRGYALVGGAAATSRP